MDNNSVSSINIGEPGIIPDLIKDMRHELAMALPSAKSILVHLDVICQALNCDSNEDLNDKNRTDIEIALSDISEGKLLY